MKVKELIEKLQGCNPESEVVINKDGEAINDVNELPGYWDGYYQKLIKNETLPPSISNIEGIEFTRGETKVILSGLSLNDLMENCFSIEKLNNLKFVFNENLGEDKIKLLKEFVLTEMESYKKTFEK